MVTAPAPLNYGSFRRPDEKKDLAEAQEPLTLAQALLEQWKPVGESSAPPEEAYSEAYRLIRPHSEAFGSLSPDSLEQILSMAERSYYHARSGYFISAFHNATPITTRSEE